MRPFTKRSRDISTQIYLHGLPVKQRIDFKLCRLIHQTINGRAPAYHKDLIETAESVPGRASNRSAGNNDLVTRRTRLKLGEYDFSVAATRIWNQLPIEIKAVTDTKVFKRNLKTHLFSAETLYYYYYHCVYPSRPARRCGKLARLS